MAKTKITFAPKAPKLLFWSLHPTSFGGLLVGIDETGAVRFVEFAALKSTKTLLTKWQKTWPKTLFMPNKTKTQKILKAKNTLVAVSGSAFQRKVWQAMTEIPRGETASYGDIAKSIGKPKAARAVGMACGANPVPVLVPCHRVIAGDGSIGGFSSGLKIKKHLLRKEGVFF